MGARPAPGDGNLGQRRGGDMVRDADRTLDGVALAQCFVERLLCLIDTFISLVYDLHFM